MVALGGGGVLYEMCKKAMITKNYKVFPFLNLNPKSMLFKCFLRTPAQELDDAIRQKVPPYLYNGGKGRWGLFVIWSLNPFMGSGHVSSLFANVI